jgi:hypothetical protein
MGNLQIAILLVLVCWTPASAYTPTGNDWWYQCKSNNPECVAYVRGLADGLGLWQLIHPETASVCIPEKVEAGQLRDIGMRYLAQHPEIRHEPLSVLLGHAFFEMWGR